MPTPIKIAADALVDAANNLSAFASKDPETVKRLLKEVDKARQQVAAVLYTRTSTTIADFFTAVGMGVLGAQRQLDAQAVEDAKKQIAAERGGGTGAAAAPVAPATVFRIPRVSAELKYSMESLQQTDVNLLVYSESSQARELHQHTIQLEVVAAPVPVDYMNALREKEATRDGGRVRAIQGPLSGHPSGAPETPVVEVETEAAVAEAKGPLADIAGTVSAARAARALAEVRALDPWVAVRADSLARGQALALAAAADKQVRGDKPSIVKRLLLPNRERAIVFDDKAGGHFVLVATGGKRPDLGLWQVVAEPLSIRLLLRMPRDRVARRRYLRLHALVLSLGDALAGSGQE